MGSQSLIQTLLELVSVLASVTRKITLKPPLSAWQTRTEPSPLTGQPTSNDMVMAWAIDAITKEPRYILELSASERGASCGCICVSCSSSLIAVNAAKTEFRQRPHFRHPPGSERDNCLILTARYTLAQQLSTLEWIELPRRIRSRQVKGLSGTYYEAWAEAAPQKVKIGEVSFEDKTKAILKLEDGRELIVDLVGSLSTSDSEQETSQPTITIVVSDPVIAGMPAAELRKHLSLLMTEACWKRHWDDETLTATANDKAIAEAEDALDWLDELSSGDVHHLSPSERRESLLHFAVKSILEQEKKLDVPELRINATVKNDRTSSTKNINKIIRDRTRLQLSNIRLEKRQGNLIPDVLAEVVSISPGQSTYPLLVEVTVHNHITEEREERIKAQNLATLEIDLSRLGGKLTKDELSRLVIEELSIKRWVHHPAITQEINLAEDLLAERVQWELGWKARYEALMSNSLDVCGQEYLKAVTEYANSYAQVEPNAIIESKRLWQLEELGHHLEKKGYPGGSHSILYKSILPRLLSIKYDQAIGYRLNTGWQVINTILMDMDRSRKWHTLYLMAIRIYSPNMSNANLAKYRLWRDEVSQSLLHGQDKYVRDGQYDALLSLLFPELKEALAHPLGKAVRSAKSTSKGVWLTGQELVQWIRQHPDRARDFYSEAQLKQLLEGKPIH